LKLLQNSKREHVKTVELSTIKRRTALKGLVKSVLNTLARIYNLHHR